MSSSPSLFSNFTTPFPTKTPFKHLKHLVFTSQNHKQPIRTPSLHASTSSTALPINVDYLDREFSGHGVSFEGLGDSCVVKMRLDNGSSASLMLPSGLITSYKPFMWHGATMEVLHTLVSEEERNDNILIQGGVSMELGCVGADGRLVWSLDKWALLDVSGGPQQSIQLELVSVGQKDIVDVKCLVTLREDLLGSEIMVSNLRSSSIQLVGSVMSHLSVSTPDATYAVGLLGSSYHNKEPMASGFSIIPPESGEAKNSIQPLGQKGFDALFSGWGKAKITGDHVHEEERGEDGEDEDDDYMHMTEKMCRVYTHTPREFTIMDRGKRNSVVVQRSGFNEFYVYSPGSDYEWYGKYAYVCIGPSAVLKPVVLCPGGSWTGAQYLFNPNV